MSSETAGLVTIDDEGADIEKSMDESRVDGASPQSARAKLDNNSR